ncbi:hypothetical protein [Chryseobacterium sp. Mn2064]|uniref:hypothetical protein n=1 Tax=Chryseobacterium sp. Mn2064 TaxID=3395263 RepID=UPI003BD1BA94
MKFKSLLLATLLAMASCSDNDELPVDHSEQTITENTSKISWNYPVLSPVFNGLEQNYMFEYDSQGRVTKKNGGVVLSSGASGGLNHFTNLIYTKVTYTGNTAVIDDYSSDPSFNVQLNERKFDFDNLGRIIKSVIPSTYNIQQEKHLTYTYDTSGRLIEILTEFPNLPYDSTDPDDYVLTFLEKFTYNSVGNLEKAVRVERHNSMVFKTTQELQFSNFDGAQNPFKNLGIFTDYFYLSLSKNNFQKQIIKEFDYSGQVSSTKELSWTNQYNNGRLKLFY